MMSQDLSPDQAPEPALPDLSQPGICWVGVFDHALFNATVQPTMDRLRKPATQAAALSELNALIAGIGDKVRREDAVNQLERLQNVVVNGRWNRAAAGAVVEAICVGEMVRVKDLSHTFRTLVEFLTPWNYTHADTMLRFFAGLADRTMQWASAQEVWRAVLPPDELPEIAQAMSDLTPLDLRESLAQAEGGAVFSPEEAAEIAEWWGEFRKIVRLSMRLDRGLYLCVRSAQP